MYDEKDLEIVELIGAKNFKKLKENGYKITKAKIDLDFVLPKDKIVLTVQLNQKGEYRIINYSNGFVNESYLPCTREKAIVSMTSLLCGFQPPRGLESFDIPFPQIQSESQNQNEE